MFQGLYIKYKNACGVEYMQLIKKYTNLHLFVKKYGLTIYSYNNTWKYGSYYPLYNQWTILGM